MAFGVISPPSMRRTTHAEDSDDEDSYAIREWRKELALMSWPYKCTVCAVSYIPTLLDLRRHVRFVHPDAKLFACDICKKTFKRKDQCVRHQQIHGNKNPLEASSFFKCSQCCKLFSLKYNLNIHERMAHSNERPYACTVCRKTFKLKAHCQRHELTHRYDELKCGGGCKIRFTCKENLDLHEEVCRRIKAQRYKKIMSYYEKMKWAF